MTTEIKIYFAEPYFDKGEMLSGLDAALQITSTPKKTWWRRFLQFITLGLYQAPMYYTAKVIPYEK